MAILEGNEPILTDEELKRNRLAKKTVKKLQGAPNARSPIAAKAAASSSMLHAGASTAKGMMNQAGEAVINIGNDIDIPLISDFGDEIDKASPPDAGFSIKKAIQNDFGHTKDFGNEVNGILSGKKAKAAAEIGTGRVDSLADLKRAGGDYLGKMGGGSKVLGGAKVGAYMIGASMLTDFLNPFDDD